MYGYDTCNHGDSTYHVWMTHVTMETDLAMYTHVTMETLLTMYGYVIEES